MRKDVYLPAFILAAFAPPPAMLEEYIIEFETVSGGKMRIQWKAAAPPDVGSLQRAWRETEG
jgi:hypothetical protein